MLKFVPQPQKTEITGKNTYKINHIGFNNCILENCVKEEFIKFCALPKGNDNIYFKEDKRLDNEEYILITGKIITVYYSSAAGQLYALQTLKQLFLQCSFEIPEIKITDKPKYKIRGFMLDVGRYFFPVNDIKKFIEIMAMHKLNLFHFHLTEDQGWRIEIKKYPLLTEIGSKRTHTNYNHTPHGGFYTQEEIREIVEYAHSFCIKIMPEFDIPGHSMAAIASYNNLTCFPRKLSVSTHWGVKHDVLCAGKESTFEFVKNVIDELCELFPDEYIHIGGDEVPNHHWDFCPNCTKRREDLGLNNSDELQYWFMNRMKNYCKTKGKQVFMWNWGLSESDMLDTDIGFTLCDKCSVSQERVYIDTVLSAYYLDMPYGYVSLKQCSDYKPSDDKNCLGIEGSLWSEYVPDMSKAQRMMFPRLSAICESAWTGDCSYKKIKDKSDFYLSYLKKLNFEYISIKKSNPEGLKKILSILWFEKRQLTWQGLSNIFRDKKIEKIANKNK